MESPFINGGVDRRISGAMYEWLKTTRSWLVNYHAIYQGKHPTNALISVVIHIMIIEVTKSVTVTSIFHTFITQFSFPSFCRLSSRICRSYASTVYSLYFFLVELNMAGDKSAPVQIRTRKFIRNPLLKRRQFVRKIHSNRYRNDPNRIFHADRGYYPSWSCQRHQIWSSREISSGTARLIIQLFIQLTSLK